MVVSTENWNLGYAFHDKDLLPQMHGFPHQNMQCFWLKQNEIFWFSGEKMFSMLG